MRRWQYWWMVWLLTSILLVSGGLAHGQWAKVKVWADTLCTGCIGLSTAKDMPMKAHR